MGKTSINPKQSSSSPRVPNTRARSPAPSHPYSTMTSSEGTPRNSQASVRPKEGAPPSSSSFRAKSISQFSRVTAHMVEPVRPSGFAEFELILLTLCTGIQDAVSFPDYHCFASNQTGNTVFLMVAIILPNLNGEVFVTANIGMALGLFLFGGWLTGQLSHLVGPRKRYWLILCNFLQSCLVFVAAVLQYRYGTKVAGPVALAVVALLSFASGSQVVQSRSLAMTEISTAMATAAWVDLLIDRNMFAPKNRQRNRRLGFLLALFLGSLMGAGIYKRAGSATAVFVSAGGKLLVAIMYFFNGAEKPVQQDAEQASLPAREEHEKTAA